MADDFVTEMQASSIAENPRHVLTEAYRPSTAAHRSAGHLTAMSADRCWGACLVGAFVGRVYRIVQGVDGSALGRSRT